PVISRPPQTASQSSSESAGVTRMEQESRAGHRGVTIWTDAPYETAFRLERVLFDANCRVHALPADASEALLPVCRALNDAGVIALVYGSAGDAIRQRLAGALGAGNFVLM